MTKIDSYAKKKNKKCDSLHTQLKQDFSPKLYFLKSEHPDIILGPNWGKFFLLELRQCNFTAPKYFPFHSVLDPNLF